MSMISELVKGLRKLGNQWKHNDVAAYHMIFDAAYTIEMLSAKLSAHNLGNGGWIPCSERLPSKAEHRNDMVLVCYGNGSIRFNTYMNGWVQGFPIAWMPLPEPYKAGDSE